MLAWRSGAHARLGLGSFSEQVERLLGYTSRTTRNHPYVDVHHVEPRAEGGRNTPDNLLTPCTAHHRRSSG